MAENKFKTGDKVYFLDIKYSTTPPEADISYKAIKQYKVESGVYAGKENDSSYFHRVDTGDYIESVEDVHIFRYKKNALEKCQKENERNMQKLFQKVGMLDSKINSYNDTLKKLDKIIHLFKKL